MWKREGKGKRILRGKECEWKIEGMKKKRERRTSVKLNHLEMRLVQKGGIYQQVAEPRRCD